MESDNFVLRRANLADADAIAEVARYSRKHFLPYLPELHTLDEDKVFFRTVVSQENDVWLAEDEDEVVGFCAFRGMAGSSLRFAVACREKAWCQAIEHSEGDLSAFAIMDVSKKCSCHQLL